MACGVLANFTPGGMSQESGSELALYLSTCFRRTCFSAVYTGSLMALVNYMIEGMVHIRPYSIGIAELCHTGSFGNRLANAWAM